MNKAIIYWNANNNNILLTLKWLIFSRVCSIVFIWSYCKYSFYFFKKECSRFFCFVLFINTDPSHYIEGFIRATHFLLDKLFMALILKRSVAMPVCPINEIHFIMPRPLGSVCVTWIQCVVSFNKTVGSSTLMFWIIPQGFSKHANSLRKVINEWSGTRGGICWRNWLAWGI